MNVRVGFGYDVHRLEEGHPLWLGGVKIESVRGAVGHSDADVLIHAICDAILGAAGLPDIGFHFPNSDERWRGKESTFFLREVTAMLAKDGWTVCNVDCTVCLEDPMIGPHVPAMKKVLAPLLKIGERLISIKATTNEGLGYIGAGNGITAYASVLIQGA